MFKRVSKYFNNYSVNCSAVLKS